MARSRGGGSSRGGVSSRGGGGGRFIPGLVVGVILGAAVALVAVLRSPPSPPDPAQPSAVAAPSGATAARATPPAAPPTKAPPPAATAPAGPTASAAATPPPSPRPPAATAPAGPTGPAGPAHAPTPGSLPRVAIVLDDCGQRFDLMERAVRSRVPLTFAVIPHLPASRRSAELAHEKGAEVIVHQPMQPEAGDEDPGQDAIAPGMKRERIVRILRASFDDVPHAVGMNNHMGSRATADAALMEATFAALEQVKPGALFLDSRTTAQTVALDVARRQGIAAVQRSVFLDNDLSASAIRGELDRLAGLAATQGEAVAIGHLKPETLDVLESVLPAMEGRDCRFVFLSALVR